MNISPEIAQIIPFILIFVIMYFLLIRPQQKKMKEHTNMLTAIRRGDKVVLNGGIIGTVSRVTSDTELQVEIADKVQVRVVRSMIAQVLAKTGIEEVQQEEAASK